MSTDVFDGQPLDEFGVPVTLRHSPQTGLPVWQVIHQLETPVANPKIPQRPHTHICVLCSANSIRQNDTGIPSWRKALMRQRMSTNAMSHLQRLHPLQFEAIGQMKKRQREEKGEHGAFKVPTIRKKKAKAVVIATERETTDKVEIAAGKQRATALRLRSAEKTAELVKKWLLATGLPINVVQDDTFQKLIKLSSSVNSAALTASSLNAAVQDEFSQFGGFLKAYLAQESKKALGLPFLSINHEFRVLNGADSTFADNGATPHQSKAFLSASIGFIDSQWRRMDLALVAKEFPQNWNQDANQLITQSLSEVYGIQNLGAYARFQVTADEALASSTPADSAAIAPIPKQEDHLTQSLRRCVVSALGLDEVGEGNTVRRILRLLQELVKYFADVQRATALQQIGATHGVPVSFFRATLVDEMVLSTSSIGGIAELLRISCARYCAYSLYFQSSTTASQPELETVWMQLSMDDWQTVVEIEAILNQLGQFRLEERRIQRPGAVASSYALLFRRLLSVSINSPSLKCLSLDEETSATSAGNKRLSRRKGKRVDMFTPVGQQCIGRLRLQIANRFTAPSTSVDIDNEIKAMLLDPRISSKAASLVADARALRRAQDALRQEHRVIFEELASQSTESNVASEEHEEEDSDDDEMSALLMVDGPKNQPPASITTSTSNTRSRDTLLEEEARAWHEWQQVYVAWDALAEDGADLFDKGQYNLLKLYHHVDILKWFREVGQQAHPTAALLARTYLGQQPPLQTELRSSLLQFMKQEDAEWSVDASRRAEQRCILHHNWHQYKQVSETLSAELV